MLTVTDVASRKLNEIIAQQQEPVFGLRIHVSEGCCSGPSYGMSLAPQAETGDWIGEFGGVKVLVDPQSAPLLEGVSIDYVETLQAQGFTINNPNVTARGCGCGNGHAHAGAADATEASARGGGCGCGGH